MLIKVFFCDDNLGTEFRKNVTNLKMFYPNSYVNILQATSEDRFNYVTSPFAGSVILTLAAEGAESETKNQLITAMGGEYPDKNSYKDVLTSIKVHLYLCTYIILCIKQCFPTFFCSTPLSNFQKFHPLPGQIKKIAAVNRESIK